MLSNQFNIPQTKIKQEIPGIPWKKRLELAGIYPGKSEVFLSVIRTRKAGLSLDFVPKISLVKAGQPRNVIPGIPRKCQVYVQDVILYRSMEKPGKGR